MTPAVPELEPDRDPLHLTGRQALVEIDDHVEVALHLDPWLDGDQADGRHGRGAAVGDGQLREAYGVVTGVPDLHLHRAAHLWRRSGDPDLRVISRTRHSTW